MKLATAALLCSPAHAYWQPTAGTPWQIVLSDALQPPYPSGIKAIDGDLFSNNETTWADLESAGVKTICYFSAGSFENWRPDAGKFNKDTDLGSPLEGWEGEWWLDTNSANVRQIMTQRIELAVQKGCDAIDPDNVDAYDNDGGGLDLTQDDAVNFVRFLAAEAHNRGLAIGLKNAGAIVDRVLDVVDFQVNEQCEEYSECDQFRPFIDANKPIFGIEYTKTQDAIPSGDQVSQICNNPSSRGFSTVIKHMNLNPWLIACNTTDVSKTSISNATTATNAAVASDSESYGYKTAFLSLFSYKLLTILIISAAIHV